MGNCWRQDSNLHGFPHGILSPARLPIPPLQQRSCWQKADYRTLAQDASVRQSFRRRGTGFSPSLANLMADERISRGQMLPNARGTRLIFLIELERGGIDAVALMGGRGAIVEDVTQMGSAPIADDLDPGHSQAVVVFGFHFLVDHWR